MLNSYYSGQQEMKVNSDPDSVCSCIRVMCAFTGMYFEQGGSGVEGYFYWVNNIRYLSLR